MQMRRPVGLLDLGTATLSIGLIEKTYHPEMAQKKGRCGMKQIRILFLLVLIVTFCMAAAGCRQTDSIEPKLKPSLAAGTWIETMKVSEKDNKPYPIQYRIDSIVRDQGLVTEAIAAYNLSGAGAMIGAVDNDRLEFCLANYSAKYPKTFPHNVYGITDVAIPFDIVSLEGGPIQVEETIYQNLGTTWEIGEKPQGYDFHAGDTYHGQIVFLMVKGYSDYLIHEVKTDTAEENQIYIKGE